MKKIFSVLLWFFIAAYCDAQPYQPFPTADARWNQHAEFNAPFIPSGYCGDIQYDIIGDTVVNMLVYHKVKSSVREYWWYAFVACTNQLKNFSTHYVGAFREDVNAKKVYFLSAGATQEQLLYDFNLSLGDTLPWLYINQDSTVINRVTGIDSVLVAGIYHKCYLISADSVDPFEPPFYFHNYVWLIEGIGSTFGLFSSLYPHYWFEASGMDVLECVSVSGNPVYPNGAVQCQPLSVEILIPDRPAVEIFPNPAGDYIHLRWDSDLFKYVEFLLYNEVGELVLKTIPDNKDQEINIRSLPQGVYLYIMVGEGGKYQGKFIKF